MLEITRIDSKAQRGWCVWAGAEPAGRTGWNLGAGYLWRDKDFSPAIHNVRVGWGWDKDVPFGVLPRLRTHSKDRTTATNGYFRVEWSVSMLGFFYVVGCDLSTTQKTS